MEPLASPTAVALPTSAATLLPPTATTAPVPTTTSVPIASPSASTGHRQRPAGLVSAPVVRVVDGNTADVSLNGPTERLRLIGINTPERLAPRRPVECFGREASARAVELLPGTTVHLEPDPSQDERDRFGRLLRYVCIDGGSLFKLLMIEQGYAQEFTFRTPHKYQAIFRAAAREARTNERGLWSPSDYPAGSPVATGVPAPTGGPSPIVRRRRRECAPGQPHRLPSDAPD